jgi:cell division protease FtsH
VRRFIRSALFPILIVIIVAMFIEWVISSRDSGTPKAIYSAPFITSMAVLSDDLQSDSVKAIVIDPKSKAAGVTQTGGLRYYVTDIGDPAALEQQIRESRPEVSLATATVSPPSPADVQPSFTKDAVNGRVESVVLNVKEQTMEVVLKPTAKGKQERYSVAYSDPAATTLFLDQYNVPYDAISPKSAWWTSALFTILPLLLILGLWFFMMNQMQGGGSKVMSFGKSRAKRVSVDSPKVTFKDVAGVDEAVEELQEIKEFLENPKKFQQLGARIPKGVLLYGPPGTGKTLLARAVAGEAGVPFFSISGSDFVEMFVGVGASRVRDLFEQAKQNAPCIIFVDEIDAVGRHRGAGLGGGHDEREQTLNQLLVEMDGFEMKDNIILIAATNRPDILDPALLRPGRFDRQIVVDRPDRPGRKMILEVHSRGKPIEDGIDLDALAAQTPGFTGADLANLVNEAALLAARHGKKLIGMDELEEGIMRVLAGPEKKTRIISEKEKAITAYHEMGHALVGHFLEHTDPVHKISVVSRGQALGFTISLPTEDKFLTTKQELMDTLSMTLGGRAAEEVVFGEITTGAANDLEKATATAKQMIMRYGMSEELGPRTLGHNESMPFLGREFQQEPDYSEEIARQIDDEIRRIIEEAHQRATDLLTEKRELLDRISKILMARETIEASEFEALVEGVPEEEVFRERDAKEAARRRGAPPEPERRARAKQPPVPKPAHVKPINPEAT